MKKSGPKKIFGVVGDPVKHSLSPAMQGAAFRAAGLAAEYRRFAVKAARLGAFFERLKSGEIAGVNVTVPHKRAALGFMDKISSQARRVGAVNTVVVEKGKLVGHNTDGEGYVRSLLARRKIDFAKTRATVLGAGGAASAVCHALVASGVKAIAVLNRDAQRAAELAAALRKYYPGVKSVAGSLDVPDPKIFARTDLLVNATSLGMAGRPWPDLGFLSWLKSGALVSDIVYVPRETAFLARARALGLAVHHGDGMLLHQGALAFELFTGAKAPLEVMERALGEALKG